MNIATCNCHIVDWKGEEYIRWAAASWSVWMGGSLEYVYGSLENELEELFQQAVKEKNEN